MPRDRGMAGCHRNTPLPHVRHHAKFGRSKSNGTNVLTDSRRKICTLASRISRSLKIIGTDTDRSATYDFLLAIRSNYGPCRTVSEINGNFGRR